MPWPLPVPEPCEEPVTSGGKDQGDRKHDEGRDQHHPPSRNRSLAGRCGGRVNKPGYETGDREKGQEHQPCGGNDQGAEHSIGRDLGMVFRPGPEQPGKDNRKRDQEKQCQRMKRHGQNLKESREYHRDTVNGEDEDNQAADKRQLVFPVPDMAGRKGKEKRKPRHQTKRENNPDEKTRGAGTTGAAYSLYGFHTAFLKLSWDNAVVK